MTRHGISVLCVDDEHGLAALVGTYLERFDGSFDITAVTSAQEALSALADTTFDCILSDYDMPGVDGIALLEIVRAEYPDRPFVLYTGHGSEAVASDALGAGVTDYVQKTSSTDQYRRLARRIRNAVTRYREQSGASPDDTARRRRVERTLDTAPDGVVVTVDSRPVYTNPRGSALLATGDGDGVDQSGRPSGGHTVSVDEPRTAGDGVVDLLPELTDRTAGVSHDILTVPAADGEQPVEVASRALTWSGEAATVHVLREASGDPSAEVSRQSLTNAAVEASPDAILVTTADRQPVTNNSQLLDCWGFAETLLDPDSSRLLFEAMTDRTADPESFRAHVEAQYTAPATTQRSLVRLDDGTVLDTYSTPLDGDDDPRGHIWFFRDITELRGFDRTGRGVFDRMTDAVVALDEERRLTFLNERAEELLGRDAADLLGRGIWGALPDALETEIPDRYETAAETGEPVSFELHYDPLDTTFGIRVYPSDTGLTIYFRDITERHRTQEQLRAAVDILHDLYTVASDRERSFAEKQQELLELGASYLDVPYGFVTDIEDGEQRITASVGGHDLLQSGESCPLEESYCRKTITTDDGFLAVENAGESGWTTDTAYEVFELETYIGGRVTVEDELYGTVCFASSTPRDGGFSEMERTFVEVLVRWLSYELEQRAYRARLETSNEQLEEFASVVSHDLRNPLGVASLRLELAREECDSEHLDDIERAHTRIETLIDDILTLAREGAVVDEPAPVSLSDLCLSCWSHVDTGAATVDVTAEEQILADESRLSQLLENLVRNAVEHGGSDVTVSIGDLPDGFYLEDDGVGIPPDRRDGLLDPDRLGESDDTRIGLRVVRKVADAHGWTVTVTESPNGGARFEFTGVERP